MLRLVNFEIDSCCDLNLVAFKIRVLTLVAQCYQSLITKFYCKTANLKILHQNDFVLCNVAVAVQTCLSLPLELPIHVEEVLKPYFQTDCDRDNNQELYKKLFEFEEQRTPESVQTSPALSVDLSPIEMSPFQCKEHPAIRNSGVFGNTPPVLRECELSPIHTMTDTVSRRSATRLDFSNHMSVDSIVLVPDSCSDNVQTNKSFTFGKYFVFNIILCVNCFIFFRLHKYWYTAATRIECDE